MKTLALLLAAVLLAASCSNQIVDAPGPISAGGGGGGGDGGSGGGDGGVTCEALIADLTTKIALARACTSVGTWDDCDESAWAKDECGCGAPLNHSRAAEVAAAQVAADAIVAAGCVLTCAPQTCHDRYKDPSYNGGCMATAPGMGLCTFPGAA
jgi:hypothetical protein